MKTKTALITGATGGLGSAVVKHLSPENWLVHAPVRDEKKARTLHIADNIVFEHCQDLADEKYVELYIRSLRNQTSELDLVALTTGTFEWDNDTRGGEIENLSEHLKEVKERLWRANVLTKEPLLNSLIRNFGPALKNTDLYIVGSQAANFAKDDPRRLNEDTKFSEEYYIQSMQKVAKLGWQMYELKLFKNVYLFEPGLIDTEMARLAFTVKTIHHAIDWSKVDTPAMAAEKMFGVEPLQAAL